jgi:hypothetical protein
MAARLACTTVVHAFGDQNTYFVLLHMQHIQGPNTRWIQLCVHGAQPCMQGSGDAAYLLCMLCCLYLQASQHKVHKVTTVQGLLMSHDHGMQPLELDCAERGCCLLARATNTPLRRSGTARKVLSCTQ